MSMSTMLIPALILQLFASAAPLGVGHDAPDFTAVDTEGQTVHLLALKQRGPVVLVFFPKAHTRGCTKQLKALVSRGDELNEHGAQVVAISGDTSEVLTKFRHEMGAHFSFIADPKGEIIRKYETKMPLLNRAQRRTFLIDTLGHIVFTEGGMDAIALRGVVKSLASLNTRH